jgi:hypothetical protein
VCAMRLPLVCLALAALPLAALARQADDWTFDVIERKVGKPLSGLVIEQSGKDVTIRCVSRKRGSPTVTFTQVISRDEISKLVLLPDKERALLKERLDGLKNERQHLVDQLRLLDSKVKSKDRDEVPLEPVAWPTDDKVKALGYGSSSSHFRLVADTKPELARLAAILLEQVYSAYSRFLPPRTEGKPTTILLTRSLGEYQKIAKSRNLNLFNPAFYDPGRNQVVCGSDLQRLSDELLKVRDEHAKLRTTIKERRTELNKAYKGKVPAELLAPLADAEKRMPAAEKKNEEAFVRVRERLFKRLYHEAFHAYLNTFVYPAKDGTVPHWLNEGLAQIFETAIVEVGELRVGHADQTRLKATWAAIKEKKLLPLADLLRSAPRDFLVEHARDQQVSNRHYLASWALAFHLTFQMRLVGTKKLDEYVAALKRGVDPLVAFSDLVGKPIDKFEQDHLHYLDKLKPDGTMAK